MDFCQISTNLVSFVTDCDTDCDTDFCIFSLVWDVDIDVTAEKSQTDPDDKDIDVNVDFDNGTYFVFTPFGYRFVQACKNK